MTGIKIKKKKSNFLVIFFYIPRLGWIWIDLAYILAKTLVFHQQCNEADKLKAKRYVTLLNYGSKC